MTLERNLNFEGMKNRFWERPNNINEETKLRRKARININKIERLETEIKGMKRLKIPCVYHLNYLVNHYFSIKFLILFQSFVYFLVLLKYLFLLLSSMHQFGLLIIKYKRFTL